MKMSNGLVMLALGVTFQGAAFANDELLTAHVSAEGKVLRQWPQWITEVDYQPKENYFSRYALKLNSRIVHKDPGFCSVSPIDASTYARQLHGQAKVIGKPLAEKVDVMTQLVDKQGASGDNSLEFLVMCSR
ncbi:hypothetical protein KMS_R00890 [Pseudomonas sp. LRP2-20]|uniref:hypothetical protein n=1 Tax=Pseudomonas sp. LRP2-20 TaxID=2944234 RepID=UPI002186196C|nr:hypothetical protein [Pseudomonas sp. LRP2-20]BDM20330.1 hypothetical protein KMS_R00890 [Pseudomonas sp. LRP2-20]